MAKSITESEKETADRIIAAFDAGPDPDGRWVMPWDRSADGPTNVLTGRAYAGGFNCFMLMLAGLNYGDSRWAGAGQWKKSGNPVRRGEAGTPIWFPRFKCAKCGVMLGWGKKCRNGHPTVKAADKVFAAWGSSYTFNNQQTARPLAAAEVKDVDPEVGFERAAAMVKAAGADVRHGGGRAFYRPGMDFIQVPEAGAFKTVADYWSTMVHEHAHWTGAASRLNRPGIVAFSGFGSETYAFEELIAEISAAFVCNHLGIEREGLFENHVAYIASWKKKLTEDPGCIRKACQQAGAVMRFLVK